jgi:lipoprotein-anchoring transpeptidase ErfK/SrfK
VTSAASKLSDWPDGGFAGIHGTDQPRLLGDAVSHGCVRVSNAVARALERLAPLGSPVDLLP